jgi:hypothetical protein
VKDGFSAEKADGITSDHLSERKETSGPDPMICFLPMYTLLLTKEDG